MIGAIVLTFSVEVEIKGQVVCNLAIPETSHTTYYNMS